MVVYICRTFSEPRKVISFFKHYPNVKSIDWVGGASRKKITCKQVNSRTRLMHLWVPISSSYNSLVHTVYLCRHISEHSDKKNQPCFKTLQGAVVVGIAVSGTSEMMKQNQGRSVWASYKWILRFTRSASQCSEIQWQSFYLTFWQSQGK